MRLVLIIVLVGGLLIVVVAGALGWAWWSRHREELLGSGKAALEEGARLGKTATDARCLEEAVARRRAQPAIDFSAALSSSLFLRGCLEASRPTPGFCDGVPRSTDPVRTLNWQMERCAKLGFSDSHCGAFIGHIPKHCASRSRAKAAAEAP